MFMFAMFLVFLATFKICQDPLIKICHWLKPLKFSISFGMYTLSMGWYLEYLKSPIGSQKVKFISRWIAFWILLNMGVIFLLSWQSSDSYAQLHLAGGTSHHLADVFHFLGNTAIIMNTLVVLFVAYQFFKPLRVDNYTYLMGIRLGFVVFILSCSLGGILLNEYGLQPPDPYHLGLPFSQIYSFHSNLNTMHFMGIHSLQFCQFLDITFPTAKVFISF